MSDEKVEPENTDLRWETPMSLRRGEIVNTPDLFTSSVVRESMMEARSRDQWEDEREQLLVTLDSVLASGFQGLRQDMDEQAGVLTRIVDELRGIKERLDALEHLWSEPARRKGGSPLDRIRNKEAREFWEDVFGDEEEVQWTLFQTCLSQKFRWLKQVIAIDGMDIYKFALGADKTDTVSLSYFAAFTNLLGLKLALAELLSTAVGRDGFTCLMHVCTHGMSLDLVKEMCELGGEELIHAKTKNGTTSLFCAAYHGHIHIAQYLCRIGGRPLFDAMQGEWTPIDAAAHLQNTAMVNALKEASASWRTH